MVLVRTIDYYNTVENLFSDPSKFKQIYNDPTPTSLTSLQRYLKQLNKRGELPDAVYNNIRLKHAKIARAHGLPKVHKAFDDIPPFRPIIDTIGTTHSSAGKYLSEVLYPLIQNQLSIKDSFDAGNRINSILPEVTNSNDLVFVSLDVVSLFTNVPLKKTVNIILKRVYNNKEISTTLSKRSLKKLILGTYQKIAFSLNNKIYEQIDGVSIEGSLGPVLPNIIMTEFERVVVEDLIKTGIVKLYARYVDDTLLVIKRKGIDFIQQKFISFDKSLKLTIDTFEHCVARFLDIEICPNGLDIYQKNKPITHNFIKN